MKNIRDYAFFSALTALPFVDAVYVYGSRARGEADERSDVNLAVLCPEASDADWESVRRIADEADMLVKVEATRLDRVPQGTTLRGRIEMERTPLFIRDTKSHASLIADLFTLMQWHLKVLQDAMTKEFASAQERQKTLAEHFRKAVRYFWRVARRALIVYGIRTHSPLATFKNAVMEDWLKQRELWEQLFFDWQQLIPHGTPETLERIEVRLPHYINAIEAATQTIQKAVNDAQTH